MPDLLMGVDLGGTKIEGVLLDANSLSKPICRQRIPTEQEGGYEHILGRIASLCSQIAAEVGIPLPDAIGIGTPGTLEPSTGLLRGSNTQCLNGRRFQNDLEKLMERRLLVSNDANCFALAEATLGCARDYGMVFGMIVGTGVGGGLVIQRRVWNGVHGIAGEWGQVVLDPRGPVSVYGSIGTIEAHISGPAIQKYYTSLCGEKCPLPEIVKRSGADADAHAMQAMNFLLENFSKAVAILVNTLDPDAFVLGGGVGNIDELYSETTREMISRYVFSPDFRTPLLKPALGDSAGVFGAALLTKGFPDRE